MSSLGRLVLPSLLVSAPLSCLVSSSLSSLPLSLLSWPDSVWTLPESSGYTLPHIYKKNPSPQPHHGSAMFSQHSTEAVSHKLVFELILLCKIHRILAYAEVRVSLPLPKRLLSLKTKMTSGVVFYILACFSRIAAFATAALTGWRPPVTICSLRWVMNFLAMHGGSGPQAAKEEKWDVFHSSQWWINVRWEDWFNKVKHRRVKWIAQETKYMV